VEKRSLAVSQFLTEKETSEVLERHRCLQETLPSVEQSLPLTLQALERAMVLSDEALLEHCCRFLGVGPWDIADKPRPFTVSELLLSLAQYLLAGDDEDGCVATAALFSRILNEVDRDLSATDFLRAVTNRYAQNTRYLLPLLHHYARASLQCAMERESADIFLFLRDGLAFWPAFRAAQAISGHPSALRHLIYTRTMRQQGQKPRVTHGDGHAVSLLEPMTNCTLVDVGLYGTLIQTLHNSGFLIADNTVLFLGSLNPHIAGFMNQWNQAKGETASINEIVALIDTVECLMKPLQLVTKIDQGGGQVLMRSADPISFVCAARFMRDLFHHTGECSFGQMTGWYLEEPIPAWKDAAGFIDSWSVPSCVLPSTFNARHS
jgi:hypothetical protein